MLSWWDYYNKSVLEKEDQLTVIEYRTGDVGLTKAISNKDLDIYIIPEWIVIKLHDMGKLDDSILKDLKAKRDYIKAFKLDKISCIPYLWGVTSFYANEKVSNFEEMIKLKMRGRSVRFLDDKMEFFYRFLKDYNLEKCFYAKKLSKKCEQRVNSILSSVKTENFKSSIDGNRTFDIYYGWHGVLAHTLDKKEKYQFFMPELEPVVGSDYICISKKKRTSTEIKKLKIFVENFSSKKSIAMHSRQTLYFSPFKKNNIIPLPKKLSDLYYISRGFLTRDNYIKVGTNKKYNIKLINYFWKKIRF
jgi:hypothetical protein